MYQHTHNHHNIHYNHNYNYHHTYLQNIANLFSNLHYKPTANLSNEMSLLPTVKNMTLTCLSLLFLSLAALLFEIRIELLARLDLDGKYYICCFLDRLVIGCIFCACIRKVSSWGAFCDGSLLNESLTCMESLLLKGLIFLELNRVDIVQIFY